MRDVLCVALDRSGARVAVRIAAEAAAADCAGALVIASFPPAFYWANPLAGMVCADVVDPTAISKAEIRGFAGDLGSTTGSILIRERGLVLSSVTAILGEGCHDLVVVAYSKKSSRRLAEEVSDCAARYAKVTTVSPPRRGCNRRLLGLGPAVAETETADRPGPGPALIEP